MGLERREVWAKRVERWLDSGLTLREYATEIGVNANTLAGWRWRLGSPRRDRRPEATSAGAATFLEVVGFGGQGSAASAEACGGLAAPANGSVTEPLQLVLRSGHCIRIPSHFDPLAVRRLVDALEAP